MNGKISNPWQVRLAEEITVRGKRCILVKNGALEFLFNADNALDVVWARYKGVNVSFLSKNGLNDGKRDFFGNFEGGFLYTCGTDNVSSCVKGRPVHGSMHYKAAEKVCTYEENGDVFVCGEVRDAALFGKNIAVKRRFCVSENSLTVSDTVKNEGFTDGEYVLLYHFNYGYPFLDEGLEMTVPAKKSEPLTKIAKKRAAEMYKITAPADGGEEDVYYHYMEKGEIRLYSAKLGIGTEMTYDTADFPVTLEWKSMISGDYALGIEPSFTRFDEFRMRKIASGNEDEHKITIKFQG